MGTATGSFVLACAALAMVFGLSLRSSPLAAAEGYYVIDAQFVTGVDLTTGAELISFVAGGPAAGGVTGLQFTSRNTLMMLCSNSGSGDKVYRYTSTGGNTWIKDESGTVQQPGDEGCIRFGRRMAIAKDGSLLGIGQNSHDLRSINAMRYIPEFPASLYADRIRLFSPALRFPYDLAASSLDDRYAVAFYDKTLLIGGVGADVIQPLLTTNTVTGICFDYAGYNAGGETHSLLYVTDGPAVYRYDATNLQPYGGNPLDRSNPVFIPAGTGGMTVFYNLSVDPETGTLFTMGRNGNYGNGFDGSAIVMAGFSTVDGTIRGLNGSATDPVIYHRPATNSVFQFCLRPALHTESFTTGNHTIDGTLTFNNPAKTLSVIATGAGVSPTVTLNPGATVKNIEIGNGGDKDLTALWQGLNDLMSLLSGAFANFRIPDLSFLTAKMGAAATGGGEIKVEQGGSLATTNGWVTAREGGVVTGGGAISGYGLIAETNGMVAPGDAVGQFTVQGDLTLKPSSILDLEIGGTVAGTSYDVLTVQNSATSGVAKVQGKIVPRLVNGFVPQASDVFTAVTATSVLTGPIENLESGRIFTANRRGSFAASFVNGGKDLQLTDFRAEAVQDNADLDFLVLDTVHSDPTNFDPAVTSYDVTVNFNKTSVLVYVQTADANATVKVNGLDLDQFGQSPPIPLSVGISVINTVVTAPDGVTKKTYTINLTRSPIAPGDFDPSFVPNEPDNPNVNIGDGQVAATAVQPDGKILIGGTFTKVANVARPYLARLNADGSLDANFDADVDGSVEAIYVQPDGRILIGGMFSTVHDNPRVGVARVDANGALDANFLNAQSFYGVNAIAVQSDGKIIVAGGFFGNVGTVQNPIGRNGIARLEPEGTIDESYNPDANSFVESVALQADGKLLVVGAFTRIGGENRGHIARLETNGTADTEFSPSADLTVRCVAVRKDQHIVIGGRFATVNGTLRRNIASLAPTGELDPFELNLNGSVNALAIRADGGLVIAGSFYNIGIEEHPGIAWIQPNGDIEQPSFNPAFTGGGDGITNLAVQADGKVIVAHAAIFRLYGGPASHLMDITGGNRLEWLRGGSAAETHEVEFEASTDGGSTFFSLGAGSRFEGGWELAGVNPPAGSFIRALARSDGGDGSSSFPAVVMLPVPTDFSIASADPGEEWTFTATHAATVPGLFLRVQSTISPEDESTWTDLPGGGQMTRTGDTWTLVTANIPYGLRHYRVLAAATGFVDSKVVFPASFNNPSPTGPILFTRGAFFDRDLVLMQFDGSGKTELSDDAVLDVEPEACALSPDGQFAAFTTIQGELFVMKAQPMNAITNVPVDILATSPATAVYGSTFCWAPDGRHIAFFGSGGNIYVIQAVDGAGNITPHSGATNPAIDVADTFSSSPNPAWSADGRHLALVGGSYIEVLRVMNANGVITPQSDANPLVPLTKMSDFTNTKLFASWAPDGQRIAFIKFSGSTSDSTISILNAADGAGNLTPESDTNQSTELYVSTGDPAAGTVSWSPDGSLLAVGSNNGGDYFVEVIRPEAVDQDNPRLRLTPDLEGDAFQPSFAQAVFNLAPPGAPEIAVEGPLGTDLEDNNAFINCGSLPVLTSGAPLTFTITNAGTADLKISYLMRDGPHFGDFAVFANTNVTITPGGTEEFTVVFTPSAGGLRNGIVRIVCDDADENPFDFNVHGFGVVEAAEIAVEQPENTVLVDGTSTVSFGTTGVFDVVVREFIIRNSGNINLTGLTMSFDGANFGEFTSVLDPVAPVAANGDTKFRIRFRPTAAGARNAVLHIASNDSDEDPFDINLTGTATPPPPAGEMAVEQPVLNGLADNDGNPVAFGSVANGGSATLAFTLRNTGGANLTGIAASMAGAAAANYSFTKPAASLVPGATTQVVVTFKAPALPATGARNAILKIASSDANESPFEVNLTATIIPPTLPVFTLHPQSQMLAIGMTANFSSAATGNPSPMFQYRKGTAAVAGAKSNNLVIANLALAQAGPYKVQATNAAGTVTSNTAELGVVENAPHSYILSSGGNVTFTCNAAGTGLSFVWKNNGVALVASAHFVDVTKNKVTIKGLLGSDRGIYTCQVTGAAGTRSSGNYSLIVTDQAPDITPLANGDALPAGIVSRAYNYQVPFDPAPEKTPTGWMATGLPPGLKINGSGVIAGIPTAAKLATNGTVMSYAVKITASNGKSKEEVNVTLLVAPLPAGAVGKFEGPIVRSPQLNGNLGGRFELETRPSGSFSGKITLGTVNFGFAGVLAADAAGLTPQGSATITRKGLPNLNVTFTIDTANHRIDIGDITDGPNHVAFIAWRKIWTTANKPNAFDGYYTFGWDMQAGADAAPQGHGFGSMNVAFSTGVASFKIRTADGQTSAILGTPFVGPQGQILIFQLLYGTTKGSLAGSLTIGLGTDALNDADNNVTGTLTWSRPADGSATARIYKNGFGPVNVLVAGNRFAATPLILGVTAGTKNANLNFTQAGIADPGLLIEVNIGNANAITFPAGSPASSSLKVTAASGEFSGSFKIDATRTVTFQGIVVQNGAVQKGFGFFMLPQTAAASSPILSGKVVFQRP